MANTEQLQSELSTFLHKLSDANFRYVLVLKDPDGVVDLFSSHLPNDQRVIELLQQIVSGQSPSTPESSYTNSSRDGQVNAYTEENGIKLHRAIESPYFRLSVQDEHKLEGHIRSCLRELQQLQCKTVAKAWIKVVEPKKQTNYPYKGKELSRPPWWPVGIKHVEPDHLNMKERLTLMVELVLKTHIRKIETLWTASRNISTFSEYQHALLDEIFFVARAARSGHPSTLLVSDWDKCSKTSRKEEPVLLSKLDPETIRDPPKVMWQGHQRVDSAETTFLKKDVLDNQIAEEAEQNVSDSGEGYLNPAIAMEEDMKRYSMHTTRPIGSLVLHQQPPANDR